jgi:O-succinylbenzoate synthase
MDSVGQLLESVGQAVQERFPRIKLKFRPGWDRAMLQAVRKEFPNQVLHIDCNSGYTMEHLAVFQQLDEFHLAMIEQPLAHDDLVDHAQLQAAIRTPVCLDESIVSPRAARQAIALRSCRFVNVKPGRVGGLTQAVAIHNLCQAAGIPCWVGGMLESATGAAHCTALAMLDNFTYPADIFPSSRFYQEDLSDPPLELQRVPEGEPTVAALDKLPEPHPVRLAKSTVQHARIN